MATAARPGTTPLLAQLEALAEERHRDPAQALTRARLLLEGVGEADPAWPTGQWVLGLIRHELGDPTGAVDSYRRAVEGARRHHDRRAEALARSSMAVSLLSAGEAAAAQQEIARAEDLAPPSARGPVELLAALVLQRTGRLDESLVAYGRALPRLRRAGDDANVARLLVNRGTLHAYQGAFADALADLEEAEELATSLALWMLAAMAAHNVGFTLGRRGDVPASLAAFDRAESAYENQGNPPRAVAVLAADRCEVFLAAGLSQDAVLAARRGLDVLGTADDAMHRAEAQLLLARALLACDEVEDAQREATAAATAFRSARRPSWAAVADYVGMQAQVAAIQDHPGPPPATAVTRARRIATLLEAHGWPVEAMHVRTFVARMALARGRPDVARRDLAGALAAGRRGSVRLRVETWHAAALLRLAEGDRPGAKRALRRGLDLVDEHRAALGATELRTGASAHGTDLARLGLRLAVADGRPGEVLRWAERGRAGALRLAPVAPPEDAALTAGLQALREARAELREATLAGAEVPGLAGRVAHLEAAVRERSWQVGAGAGGRTERVDLRDLAAALGPRSLVELLSLEGRVRAVTVVGGRARLHDLAAVDEVVGERDYLRSGLRRWLATDRGDRRAARAARSVRAAAARLDDLLLSPLGLPDEPIVLVPTAPLHGLCWTALPSLAGRPLTVAPSAASWLRRGRPGAALPPRRVALVAGPDLSGAAVEVAALAGLYPRARVLTEAAASTAGVRAAMEAADVVHLAAHGTFRSDAPLFSSLRLADGPLTVYELERLRAVPRTIVLPACDAAQLGVRAGDEVLGTAAALLGLGVGTVVAPLLPVPDEATKAVMVGLHEHLRAGRAPSAALAAVTARDDPVAAAFVCIGSDPRSG
jgi:tetratricopeptide (TPR) repeat protein